MKSILIIEIGRFDQHLCENLTKHDNQIVAVDIPEEKLESALSYVASAKTGNCVDKAVLKSLGIGNSNICFTCIGDNFQNGLKVTSLTREMGVKYIASKVNRDIHVRLLLENGAGEVVYPDRDVAEKVAARYSANNVFDYTELADSTSAYEIKPFPQWVGKSIKDSDIRRLYGISVIAVRSPDGHMRFMSGADHVIAGDIHLMVIGKQEDAEKIVKHLTKNV